MLVIFLFVLLGDIVYDLLEISYVDSLLTAGGNRYTYGAENIFALRPLPEIVFDLMGALVGYYAGKYWWRILYIEDRRHKKYKLDW